MRHAGERRFGRKGRRDGDQVRTRAVLGIQALEERRLLTSYPPPIVELTLPTGSAPTSIVQGPGTFLWYTATGRDGYGQIAFEAGGGGTTTLPTGGTGDNMIVNGPGGELWLSEPGVGATSTGTGELSELNPATGATTQVATPDMPNTTAMASDLAGNLYFVGSGSNQIESYSVISRSLSLNPVTIPTANSDPTSMVLGPDGNLWFTESNADKIGKYNLKTGAITEYPLPTGSRPQTICAGAGTLWFTEPGTNQYASIDTSAGLIFQHTMTTANSQPWGIAYQTTGPLAGLWITEKAGNNIVAGGNEIPIPTAASGPEGVAAGSDGNIYFTESLADKIGVYEAYPPLPPPPKTPPPPEMNEYLIPTGNSYPGGIAGGPAGSVWFTETNADKIGRLSPGGGFTEYPVPTANAEPTGIVGGSDGDVYFTELVGDKIGRLNPSSGAITEFTDPDLPDLTAIADGPDGNVWFINAKNNTIGRFSLANQKFTDFPVTTPASGLSDLVAGPDGDLWFTESAANKIGKLNPSTGAVVEYAVPTAGSDPNQITLGPDGNLWFTETQSGQIGQVVPATGAITEFAGSGPGTLPVGISPGPGGYLWYTESATGTVDFFNPTTKLSGGLKTPIASSDPTGIALGPDETMYFIESNTGVIAQSIETAVAMMSETVPSPLVVPYATPFVVSDTFFYDYSVLAGTYNDAVAVSFGSNPNNATLGGATTVNAVDGVATLSGLSINTPGNYSLNVNSGAFKTETLSVDVIAHAASQVAVTTQPPPNDTINAPFGLTVSTLDPSGYLDTTYNGPLTVSLASNPGSATLGGTLTVKAVNGVATFNGLTVNAVGNGYTIAVKGSGLATATTSAFNVVPVVGVKLAVTTQPPSAAPLNGPFGFAVTAEDASGNPAVAFNGAITVTLANNPGSATLGGTLTVNAVNGVATFAGLTVNVAGNGYTFSVSGGGLTGATTNAVNVAAASATRLVMTSEPPSTVAAYAPFGLIVSAEDVYGNVTPAFNGNVTISLANNPGSSTLGGTLTVAAVNGVATFSGLTLNVPATGDTIAVSAGGLTGVTTTSIGVTPPVATQLVVTREPPGSVAENAGFGFVVTAEDALGNVATGFTGSVSVAVFNNPGGGTLGGVLTAQASAGVVTFTGLSISQPSTGYSLIAFSKTLGSATTTPFDVTNVATRLAISFQPPSSVYAGAGFGLSVSALDSFGNVVTSFDSPVTLTFAANPGSAALGGTTTATAVNGVATFTGVTVSKSGTAYRLLATFGNLTGAVTNTFDVLSVSPTQLVITSQPPPNVPLFAPFGLTVAAEDASGNIATAFNGMISLQLGVNPGNAALGGTTSVNAVNGVASFSALTLNKPGVGYTLTAVGGGLTFGTTAPFTVSPVASKLVVTTQPPSSVTAGVGFGLAVTAEDSNGNIASGFTGNVTLAIATGPGGAALGGTLTVAAVNGVATFNGLTLNKSGTGYSIAPSATGLFSGNTAAFGVVAAAPSQIVVRTQPPALVDQGKTFGLAVAAADAFGNLTTSFQGSVALSLATNPGGSSLGGTLTASAVNGVATFTGLTLNLIGNGYTIRAVTGSFAPVTTAPLAVGPHPTNDFLGTGVSIPSIFRRDTTGLVTWFVQGDAAIRGKTFGANTLDVPLTGDFDGDGLADLALYRPSTAQWYVQDSGAHYVGQLLATFGAANLDLPAPGNYNGNGVTIPAVFRPTTGQWFVYGGGPGKNLTLPVTFPAGTTPAAGDYDNVGRTEAAVYNPANSQWLVETPGATTAHVVAVFGGPADLPVPGAYDALTIGDSAVEPALWRASTGQYFIHNAATGKNRAIQFAPGDIPAPGDYDGVGETEAAVYRPSTGQWFVVGPNDASPRLLTTFGGPIDTPTSAPYAYRTPPGSGHQINALGVGGFVPVDLGSTARALSAGRPLGATPAAVLPAYRQPTRVRPAQEAIRASVAANHLKRLHKLELKKAEVLSRHARGKRH